MPEIPGRVRVQDAALANMVSISAILDYLETRDPGARAAIEARAHELARNLKQEVERLGGESPITGEDS